MLNINKRPTPMLLIAGLSAWASMRGGVMDLSAIGLQTLLQIVDIGSYILLETIGMVERTALSMAM